MVSRDGPAVVKVAVIGNGHLADATRTCVRKHFDNVAVFDEADLVWLCENTPVDENDRPDVAHISNLFAACADLIIPGTPILISSQLPVGTCRRWEGWWPQHAFFVQPENIRRAFAVDDFLFQARMVVGTRQMPPFPIVEQVLHAFTPRIFWMSPESAEMAKHALNAWLAMNICFANEIGDICDLVGADPDDVIRSVLADARVGGHAPLTPGGPVTGGTLMRDVRVLSDLAHKQALLIAAITESNEERL